MSTRRKIEWAVFLIGVSGLIFSGYLSAVKLLTETCAFNESCPYFLGYPACYFGSAMFLIIACAGGLHVAHNVDGKIANAIVLHTSFLGILFASYFAAAELPVLVSQGFSAYALGLPTCVLGLICYLLTFFLSFRLNRDFTPQ